MEKTESNVKKLCSFYVSDWHLVTMLLPYIHKSLSEEAKVATILEKNIQENIHILLQRLKLKNEEKILQIDWNRTNEKRYTTIAKKIEEAIGEEVIIVINGAKQFVNRANENVEKYIEKNAQKLKENHTHITIVDCYEIIEFNGSINEILDKHDKILNTSGEKEIEEVFGEYQRKQKIS